MVRQFVYELSGNELSAMKEIQIGPSTLKVIKVLQLRG